MAFLLVYSDAWRLKQAQLHTGATAFNPRIDSGGPGFFRIGEGGQIGGVPKTPDAALTDVEAIFDLTGLTPPFNPTNQPVYFQKDFGPGDVTDNLDGTFTCVCTVDSAEANDDGLGNNPNFYEIAVFDADGTILCYGTFDKETKFLGRTLQHTILVTL